MDAASLKRRGQLLDGDPPLYLAERLAVELRGAEVLPQPAVPGLVQRRGGSE